MTHQDDLHLADTPQDEPTMELLEGAEAEAPRACCSLGHRIARVGLYGLLVLSGTALLAISAVPELTNYVPEFDNYASFISGSGQQGNCPLSSGHCTALDVAALSSAGGSPCCPSEAAMAFNEGGCSKSCDQSSALASVSADVPSCCQKEASSACCKDEASCPLAASEKSAETPDEQPLDEETLAQLPVGEDLAPLAETETPDGEAAESETVETENAAETAGETTEE